MPLPSSAVSFERAALPAGFKAEGMVKARRSIKSPDGPMVDPISGQRFVCLDDPDDVDSRRMRNDPARALQLTNLRIVSPRSGLPTIGADGAKLICRDVQIKKGKRLVFAWHFMVWGDLPWNDFACFSAIPDQQDDYGLSLHVLMDLAELTNGGARATGWRLATWTTTADFSGTIEWIVANGQVINDPTLMEPAVEAFSNPPALLIDDIRVLG